MGYLQVIVQAIKDLGSSYDTVAANIPLCECKSERLIVGVRNTDEDNIEVMCTNGNCDLYCTETWVTYDF